MAFPGGAVSLASRPPASPIVDLCANYREVGEEKAEGPVDSGKLGGQGR